MPLYIRLPVSVGEKREIKTVVDAPDLMPTLLSLCGIAIPKTCMGIDRSGEVKGEKEDDLSHAALLQNIGIKWGSQESGIHDWRGIRDCRYTYAIDKEGPWLLYDNERDYYQCYNLVMEKAYEDLRNKLHEKLLQRMKEEGDEFLTRSELDTKWGYVRNSNGLVYDFTINRRSAPSKP